MKKFIYKLLVYILVGGIPIYIPLLIYLIGIKPYISGDLDALAMIPFPKGYVKQELCFNKTVIDCDYNNIPKDSCILVIGDSFSQSFNGTVTTYVNYLAENIDLPVYNLTCDWGQNSVYRFLFIAQKRKLPPVVIIESVERYFSQRFSEVNTDLGISQIDSIISSWKSETKEQKNEFMRSQELVRLHVFNDYTVVKCLNLTEEYFSIDGEQSSQLYFISEDLNFNADTIPYYSVISTMHKLNNIAAKQNCRLYFLVAADKYDVYYPYIKGNPYPANRTLDSLYCKIDGLKFINSKDTLSSLLRSRIKDVYWCNNTHWGPIGCKAVGEYVSNVLLLDESK